MQQYNEQEERQADYRNIRKSGALCMLKLCAHSQIRNPALNSFPVSCWALLLLLSISKSTKVRRQAPNDTINIIIVLYIRVYLYSRASHATPTSLSFCLGHRCLIHAQVFRFSFSLESLMISSRHALVGSYTTPGTSTGSKKKKKKREKKYSPVFDALMRHDSSCSISRVSYQV